MLTVVSLIALLKHKVKMLTGDWQDWWQWVQGTCSFEVLWHKMIVQIGRPSRSWTDSVLVLYTTISRVSREAWKICLSCWLSSYTPVSLGADHALRFSSTQACTLLVLWQHTQISQWTKRPRLAAVRSIHALFKCGAPVSHVHLAFIKAAISRPPPNSNIRIPGEMAPWQSLCVWRCEDWDHWVWRRAWTRGCTACTEDSQDLTYVCMPACSKRTRAWICVWKKGWGKKGGIPGHVPMVNESSNATSLQLSLQGLIIAFKEAVLSIQFFKLNRSFPKVYIFAIFSWLLYPIGVKFRRIFWVFIWVRLLCNGPLGAFCGPCPCMLWGCHNGW